MSVNPSILVGDPAPWFVQQGSDAHGDYHFDKAAGRYSVLFFFHSSLESDVTASFERLAAHGSRIDGIHTLFFGVTNDPQDRERLQALSSNPAIRFFWDTDHKVSTLYGFAADTRPFWLLVDPMLRVRAVFPHGPHVIDEILPILAAIPSMMMRETSGPVPALILSDVFEPEFCDRLIRHYKEKGARPSGIFMENTPGRSVPVLDSMFKRRRDCPIEDAHLVNQVQLRITRRIVPEIRKVFQFNATRLERLIIACYAARERGRFGPHRDDTLTAAAHRRFAVSINLNDAFAGGQVTFPEFSPRGLAPPAGGALVFSCGLMHKVDPITQGERFACLTFLYDEEAARIREANWQAARASRRNTAG